MLYEKVLNSINEHSLLEGKKTVIAAVSGGADSVCMLDIMLNIGQRLGINIECAHLNHNLRGEESDSDEAFVKKLCEKKNVKFHCKSVDVMASANGISIEDAARRARYDFFAELLNDVPDSVIATAHNANDNVETFFINLLRSCGTRGLCGIPRQRDGFIRPMLDITRQEIISHLESIGQDFCTDSTNSDTDYLRNFIRHRIIPEFETRKETDVHKTVLTAIENLKADCDALDAIADKSKTNDKNKLLLLEDAVLYRVLSRMCHDKCGIILDRKHFLEIKKMLLKDSNSKVQLRGDVYATCDYGKLSFVSLAKSQDKIPALDNMEVNGKNVLIKKVKEFNKQLTKNCIDCDKIVGNLFVRSRRDGDIFFCQGRCSTSKLKKLFTNSKIPVSERNSRIILCDESDSVVFVEGFGSDSRFAPDENSRCVLEICIKKEDVQNGK